MCWMPMVSTESANSSFRVERGAGILEVVRDCLVGKCMPQVAGSGARLQTRIDTAFFPCPSHSPCLGLSCLARWNQVRVRVAGMHLHRKQPHYDPPPSRG